MLHTSKLTTKFQATVPTPVRKALQLKAGDVVGFEVEGNVKKSRVDREGHWAAEIDNSEWRSVPQLKKAKRRLQSIARATLIKDARINIRLSAPVLHDLQARAQEEGLPYQTLIASVLHKYVSGRLVERASRVRAR